MQIRQIIASAVSTSTLMALVLATALGTFPASSWAADIAWHSKGEPAKRSWVGGDGAERSYECMGSVELKTGEKATFVCNGVNRHFTDRNDQPWDQQCVLRFDDLSAFIFHMSGSFNASTLESKGAGKFVGGTGRFEGITGQVTMVGHFSGDNVESDAVASYSLPEGSRGFR